MNKIIPWAVTGAAVVVLGIGGYLYTKTENLSQINAQMPTPTDSTLNENGSSTQPSELLRVKAMGTKETASSTPIGISVSSTSEKTISKKVEWLVKDKDVISATTSDGLYIFAGELGLTDNRKKELSIETLYSIHAYDSKTLKSQVVLKSPELGWGVLGTKAYNLRLLLRPTRNAIFADTQGPIEIHNFFNETTFIPNSADLQEVLPSNDGTRVAGVAYNGTGNVDLVLMDIEGKERRILTTEPTIRSYGGGGMVAMFTPLAWDGDNSFILYRGFFDQYKLSRFNTISNKEISISDQISGYGLPSPDGRYYAVARNKTGDGKCNYESEISAPVHYFEKTLDVLDLKNNTWTTIDATPHASFEVKGWSEDGQNVLYERKLLNSKYFDSLKKVELWSANKFGTQSLCNLEVQMYEGAKKLSVNIFSKKIESLTFFPIEIIKTKETPDMSYPDQQIMINGVLVDTIYGTGDVGYLGKVKI